MHKTYQTHRLSNKIKSAYLPYDSEVAFAGLIIPVGSANESANTLGTAHFIEHLLFKGTTKRNYKKIINALEELGGELNAYTTKEETVIYAAFPKHYYKNAIELIAEIAFDSIFLNKEIENERNVILDEIYSYKDTPSENIYDEFEELILETTSYGHNILGTEASIKTMSRDTIVEFWKQNYFSTRNLFFFMGDIPFENVNKILEKSTAPYTFKDQETTIKQDTQTEAVKHKTITEDTYQLHYILGKKAYHIKHKNRLALVLLNNIIGGPSMNSRLNMTLREKHGIAYNIDSSFTPYTHSGIFSIYLGTDAQNLNKSLKLIRKELGKLCEKPLSDKVLDKAKTQFLGQIAIGRENKENLFIEFGKQIFYFNDYASTDYIKNRLSKLTPDLLHAVAKEMLDFETFSSITIS